MKLMYRGAEYNYEPVPVDMSETGVTGQYRGQALTFTYPRHIPVPQPIGDYKYRGVSYHRTENGSVEATTSAESVSTGAIALTATPSTRVDMSVPGMTYRSVAATRNTLLKDLAGKHYDNIQRRLLHRMEVAKAKGDQQLLSQLEREMQSTAR